VDTRGSKEPCVRWDPDPPPEEGAILGVCPGPLESTVDHANFQAPFKISFTAPTSCFINRPCCKKTECWGAGVVICLERGADLHMAQLIPLPLTVSCLCKIQIGFIFLVPAHPGNPGQRAVKRVCVYITVYYIILYCTYYAVYKCLL